MAQKHKQTRKKKNGKNVFKMKARTFYEAVKARFWVIPALMVLVSLFLAVFVQFIPIDLRLPLPLSKVVFDASSENSRQILSAIATALMTVVGVLFSIVVVVLQQISAQYNPRVIEKFIRSGLSQAVLGAFIGTFVFCLLVLKQIPIDPRDSDELPHLGINLGIIGAIGCMMLLINYIHHIVYSIRAGRVVSELRTEAILSLDAYREQLSEVENYDEDVDAEKVKEKALKTDFEYSHEIWSDKIGFFQRYDISDFHKALTEKHCPPFHAVFHVIPGDYIQYGTHLATLKTDLELNQEDFKTLADKFHTGEFRTHVQDIRLGLRQLSDMALRALSPSLNDPTTACEALQGSSSVLLHFIRHCGDLPSNPTFEDGSKISLRPLYVKDLLHLAFSECTTSGREQLSVLQVIQNAHRDLLREAKKTDDILAIRSGLERISQLMEEARRKHPYPPLETEQPQLSSHRKTPITEGLHESNQPACR